MKAICAKLGLNTSVREDSIPLTQRLVRTLSYIQELANAYGANSDECASKKFASIQGVAAEMLAEYQQMRGK